MFGGASQEKPSCHPDCTAIPLDMVMCYVNWKHVLTPDHDYATSFVIETIMVSFKNQNSFLPLSVIYCWQE